MNSNFIEIVLVLIFGLCFGSFASMLTQRIPSNKSILRPPSSCDYCGAKISPANLIPILSFILSKGKSECCQKRLRLEYPLIELFTGLLFLLSYSISGLSLKFISLCILSTLTTPLILIDIRIKRLPNFLTYAGFWGGLIILFLSAINQSDLNLLIDGLALIFVTIFVFLLIYLASKGGMGLGDVKLAGMLASLTCIFQWRVIFIGIFIAFLFGALSGIILMISKKATRKSAIPFGPFMILGIWVALIISPEMLRLITSLWALN